MVYIYLHYTSYYKFLDGPLRPRAASMYCFNLLSLWLVGTPQASVSMLLVWFLLTTIKSIVGLSQPLSHHYFYSYRLGMYCNLSAGVCNWNCEAFRPDDEDTIRDGDSIHWAHKRNDLLNEKVDAYTFQATTAGL